MRHALVMVAVMVCSTPAMAVRIWELNGKHVQAFPHRAPGGRNGGGASSPNITYHNGPVLHAAKVVPIFWGPSWGTGGADNAKRRRNRPRMGGSQCVGDART